ncbi:hypothetical protein D9M70_391470 [compost metagenome]
MVAVIAAVGRKIEGDRKALLPGGKVLPVKRVGGFGRRETGILADRPGTPGIHGGARAAHEGLETRQRREMIDAVEIAGRIERLDRDTLGRLPG